MDRIWIFLQNPFLNAAGDNFKMFVAIVKYTYDRIKAKAGDAFFDTLIAILESPYQSLAELYSDWETSEGAHKSATETFKNLIGDLSSIKIKQWDAAIQGHYLEGTARYIELLPHDRKPFQSGGQAERVTAVKNLIKAIDTDVNLATLKIEVQAYFDLLSAAKTDQAAKLSATDTLSEELTLVIEVVAKFMYKILGKFMDQYYDNPTLIAPYYDLELIRQQTQIEFAKTVKASKTARVAKRKLELTDQIKIVNDGGVPITIFYAPEKNDHYTTYGVTVGIGEEVTVPASALGNLTNGHFILAYNADENNDAHFILTIIK